MSDDRYRKWAEEIGKGYDEDGEYLEDFVQTVDAILRRAFPEPQGERMSDAEFGDTARMVLHDAHTSDSDRTQAFVDEAERARAAEAALLADNAAKDAKIAALNTSLSATRKLYTDYEKALNELRADFIERRDAEP